MSNETQEFVAKKFEDMTVGQLREVAKLMQITLPAGVNKEDIIQLLNGRRSQKVAVEPVNKGSSLKPGYCRIVIAENPNAKQQIPVYLFDNGVDYAIPRGKEVDLPKRAVDLLRRAVVERRVQEDDETGKPRTKILRVAQYPFELIDAVPGPAVKTKREIAASKKMAPRRRYREMFGRWPSRAEMVRAIETGILTVKQGTEIAPEAMIEEKK